MPHGQPSCRVSLPFRRSAPSSTCLIHPLLGRTLPARGPLGDCSTSKSTSCPSLRDSKGMSSRELRWKKISWPSLPRMNPNPRSFMRRLIFPVGIAALLSPVEPSLPLSEGVCHDRKPFHGGAETFSALDLRASYTARSSLVNAPRKRILSQSGDPAFQVHWIIPR